MSKVLKSIIKTKQYGVPQKGMLFDCSIDNIDLHLKNNFASGELEKDSVTEKISATESDGKNYMTQFYNLDAVITVGYRVNNFYNKFKWFQNGRKRVAIL